MGKKKPNSSCIPAEMYSGIDLALARGVQGGGVLFFMIKQKIIK
jgi:hypothetical protein